ncbi:MAG: hypothetical protein KDB79_03570 [Acidobacteria bacterium]|nr:hypothetical protein [Acidobacteriota bacterium]
MKTLERIIISIVITGLLAIGGLAQESPIQSETLNQIEIDQIIKKFTKNEDDFRFALTNYVLDRSATVQTVGLGGLITGTFRRDSFLTFTKDGKRFEKIEYAPPSTLTEISITPQDLEDLGGVNPFAINPQDVSLYTFSYLGKQKIDDLNLHVFDVRPKVIPNPKKTDKRLFVGRIWVDDEDFMIVKSKGKGIPETKDNKFPVVETWRTNVDGKYWFPAYTAADDELVFDSGQVVKIRMRVRYDDYKQGRSEVIILDDDVEVPEEPAKDPKDVPPPKP